MKLNKAAFLILACVSLVACGKKSSTTDSSLTVLSLPLSGNWSGTGTAADDGGAAVSCSLVSFNIVFTASTVSISNFATTCAGATATETWPTLAYANGQLSYNGNTLGTYTDNELHLQFSDNQGNSYDADFVLQDATHISYTENDSGNGHSFTGTAALTKQ